MKCLKIRYILSNARIVKQLEILPLKAHYSIIWISLWFHKKSQCTLYKDYPTNSKELIMTSSKSIVKLHLLLLINHITPCKLIIKGLDTSLNWKLSFVLNSNPINLCSLCEFKLCNHLMNYYIFIFLFFQRWNIWQCNNWPSFHL